MTGKSDDSGRDEELDQSSRYTKLAKPAWQM